MILITIKGKEVISTKDILFILVIGFMLGFSTGLGIYTGNIFLSIFLILVSLTLFVIYSLKLLKTWEQIAQEVNSSSEVKDIKADFKTVKKIDSKKFFEA